MDEIWDDIFPVYTTFQVKNTVFVFSFQKDFMFENDVGLHANSGNEENDVAFTLGH